MRKNGHITHRWTGAYVDDNEETPILGCVYSVYPLLRIIQFNERTGRRSTIRCNSPGIANGDSCPIESE